MKRFDVRTSLIYGVVATLWIIFSDLLLLSPFRNNPTIEDTVSLFKSLGFVVLTTLALFIVLSAELRKRARIEQQLEYERDISPVAIVIINLDGEIIYANIEVERVLGKPRDTIIGQTYYALLGHATDFDGNPITDKDLRSIKPPSSREPIFGIQRAIDTPDGNRILLEINAAPLFDTHQTLTGFIASFSDVTINTTHEKRLRQSEESFRLLFESNPHPMWVYDLETLAFLEVNDAAVTHYGYSHNEFLALRLTDIRPPDDIPTLLKTIRQPRSTLERSGEWKHILKNGQMIDVEITSHMFEYAGRQAVLVVAQDITKRKQADKALLASESRYRMLIEQASDGIFIAHIDGPYLDVNSAGCNLLGYTHEEILQKRMLDLFIIAPDKPLRYEELLQGKTLIRERQMIRKDSTLVSVEVSSKLLLDGTVQAIVRDITERKQAEAELRLKSAALESAANGIAITDMNGIIQWVNPAFTTLTGYTSAEAQGHSPRDLIRSDQHSQHFYDEIWNIISSGQVWHGEIVNRRKDGTLYTEEQTLTPLRNEVGEITHFIGIKQDITARKLNEAALHKLNTELEARIIERTTQLNQIKNRIESILNSNADSIIYSRVDGTIEQINPAFTRIFGYQSDEILLQSLTKLVSPEDVPTLEQAFASIIVNQQVEQVEVIAYCKDGKTFDAAIMLSPVIEHTGRMVGIVSSVHDVTKRNLMLHHAMDLNVLKSHYVSMAAHDLRNPMALILTSSSTLERYLDKLSAEKKQAKFDQIKASIKVMTDILDDVLIMGEIESGKFEFHPAPLDVVAFCQMLVIEAIQATGTTITIDFSNEGVVDPVAMDAKLLRHILANLLSNAIKYSPADSHVIFTVHGLPGQIIFHIQDQGMGIPKEDQAQLFETFYRASSARHIRGTGLGLAIVKQSVELHGGTIVFESEQGRGTTFIVTLPGTGTFCRHNH